MKRNLPENEDQKIEPPLVPVSRGLNELLTIDAMAFILTFLPNYNVVLRSVCKQWKFIVDEKNARFNSAIVILPSENPVFVVGDVYVEKYVPKPTIYVVDQRLIAEGYNNKDGSDDETSDDDEPDDTQETDDDDDESQDPSKKNKAMTLVYGKNYPDHLIPKFNAICEIIFDCVSTYMNVMWYTNSIRDKPILEDEIDTRKQEIKRLTKICNDAMDLALWIFKTKVLIRSESYYYLFRTLLHEKFTQYGSKFVVSVKPDSMNMVNLFPYAIEERNVVFWCMVMNFDRSSFVTGKKCPKTDVYTAPNMYTDYLGLTKNCSYRYISLLQTHANIWDLIVSAGMFWQDHDIMDELIGLTGNNSEDFSTRPFNAYLLSLLNDGKDDLFRETWDKHSHKTQGVHFTNCLTLFFNAVIEKSTKEMLKFLVDRIPKTFNCSLSTSGIGLHSILRKCIERCDVERFLIIWNQVRITTTEDLVVFQHLIITLVLELHGPGASLNNLGNFTQNEILGIANLNFQTKFGFIVKLLDYYFGLVPCIVDQAHFAEKIIKRIGTIIATDEESFYPCYLRKFIYPTLNYLLFLALNDNRSDISKKLVIYENDWLRRGPHPSTMEILLKVCPKYFDSFEGPSIFDVTEFDLEEIDNMRLLSLKLNDTYEPTMIDLMRIANLGYTFTPTDCAYFLRLSKFEIVTFIMSQVKKDSATLQKFKERTLDEEHIDDAQLGELVKIIDDCLVDKST